MKNKRFIFSAFCFFIFTDLFAQNAVQNNFASKNSKIEKFVKGNLYEKTAAVREASGNEAVWLCDKAINYALEGRSVLGSDRELDSLAVAAVLSFPQEYIKNCPEQTKEIILNELISVFNAFDQSPNVQITVISKLNSISKDVNLISFIQILNKILSENVITELDSSVVKSAINFLAIHGNNESFVIIYNLWSSNKFTDFNMEFENAVICLIPVSMNEALSVTSSNSMDVIMSFFNLIYANKSKINENSFSQLAENVLSKSILMVKRNQKTVSSVTEMQIQCVQVLGEYKWTRASGIVLEFFDLARLLYNQKDLEEDSFVKVITALGTTAPLDAVPALIEYLESLNAKVERFDSVSENVTLAVIKTLGAIGDKSAFDSLLAVTYYSYPQSVLSAARDALSNLRW